MFPSRSKTVAVSVGLVFFATACVDQGTPGVRTEEAQADIVFGVAAPEDAELADLVPPPPATTAEGAAAAPRTLRVPFRNKLPNRFSNVAFTVSPDDTGGSCERAPLGAAPDELADRNATEPPAEGLYRYRVQGTRTMTINGQEVPTEIDSFEPRIVQNVERIDETSWRFEMVEPNGDGTRITTWLVATDATQQSAKPPYVGENGVRAGEPGRGIAVESIIDYDADGNPAGSFDAVPVLLQMPLPVVTGESFQSAAVDRQGQYIQIDGEVLDRKTVDACGELVDGWFVKQTVTSAQSLDSSVSPREYIFSTPLGGLPVSIRVQGQAVDTASGVASSWDLTYTIGQVEPSPIPEEAD